MTDIAFLPAHELARRIRRREIGSVELLDHFAARIARLDGAVNAVVVRDLDRARDRAAQADAALARGEVWGPLHGLPMTVKESFDLVGTPSTWGFEALRGNVATSNATAVQRLLDAGAVVFGKTNVPVALADWQSFNPVYGTTNNPWHVGRTPGGSSGGSAAALAAGFTGLELGSDIGASIRNPAHYCGVWGHKPSWGVVPLAGHELPGTECAESLDIAVAGPLARSAHDLALAMDLLAAPPQQWRPVGGWQPVAWRDAGTPARRLRVAVIADDACAPTDASVRGAIGQLADALRREGLAVTELPTPQGRPVDSAEAWRCYALLLRAATGAGMDDATWADAQRRAAATSQDSTDYGDWNWQGSTLSHRDWVKWDAVRHRQRRQWEAFFQQHDLLVCPVATTPAFAHQQQGFRWERLIPVDTVAGPVMQPSTTSLFWAGYPGLCGLPATAVPLGLSADGLPVGAQIVGPVLADPVCLRLARFIEDAFRAFVPPPAMT